MACSCCGSPSVLPVLLATFFSFMSFILPKWSSNEWFNAGVWACDSGFLYFGLGNSSPPSDYDNPEYALRSADGLCERYSIVEALGSSWGEGLFLRVEDDFSDGGASFYEFVGRTCTGLGGATLTFSILGWISGLFAFLFLLCRACCCSKTSCLVVTGKVLTAFACFSCFLAVILWSAQSAPLIGVDGISFGASFYLSFGASMLFAAHLKMMHTLQKKPIHRSVAAIT